MADLRISDLVTASQLKNDDYYEIAQSESGTRVSYKTTLLAIAVQIATMVDFTSDLNTTSKKITGAINELKQLISLIPQFSIEVVQELPTEDISDTTIYLVPAEDPEVGNYYEEYIHVNNTWELVGTTAVDLSAYYTKLEVDGLLATKASVTEVALKENKSDMPTDVRTIIKDCKTPKSATITNGIAQFNCIEENLVKGLKVTMNPIQDLHGYSNPWAGGAGKNKLVYPYAQSTVTDHGITFTDSGNGELVLTNMATETAIFTLSNQSTLANGNYIIRVNTVGGTDSGIRVRVRANSTDTATNYTANTDIPITIETNVLYLVEIRVVAGSSPNGCKLYPFVRLSTDTSTTWTPYSNICPISGRTEASVKRTGVNQWDEEWELGSLNTTNGSEIANTTQIRAKNYVPVQPSKQYYFKADNPVWVLFFDANKAVISENLPPMGQTANNARNSNNQPFTTPPNCAYIRFYFQTNYGTTYNHDTSVNYPSNITAYYAYNGSPETHTHQYSETIYGGSDDFVNGKLIVDIPSTAKVKLSDLNWTYQSEQSRFYTADLASLIKKPSAPSVILDMMACECYKINSFSAYINGQICVATSGNLFVKDENYTDTTTWLNAVGNCYIAYPLATPTELTLTAEEITIDLQEEFTSIFKEAFKGNKYFKLK